MSEETTANEAAETVAHAPTEEPKKTGAVWAAEKKTPKWHIAAARMVASLDGKDFEATEMTETEFDAALKRVA